MGFLDWLTSPGKVVDKRKLVTIVLVGPTDISDALGVFQRAADAVKRTYTPAHAYRFQVFSPFSLADERQKFFADNHTLSDDPDSPMNVLGFCLRPEVFENADVVVLPGSSTDTFSLAQVCHAATFQRGDPKLRLSLLDDTEREALVWLLSWICQSTPWTTVEVVED